MLSTAFMKILVGGQETEKEEKQQKVYSYSSNPDRFCFRRKDKNMAAILLTCRE